MYFLNTGVVGESWSRSFVGAGSWASCPMTDAVRGRHRLIITLNAISLKNNVVEHIKIDLLLNVVNGEQLVVFIEGGTVW